MAAISRGLLIRSSCALATVPYVDFRIEHALNRLANAHDGFADPLATFVGASEFLFLAALVIMVVAGGRSWARETALSGGLAAVLGLAVGQVVSRLVDRPRPFVSHPHAVHSLISHASDPGFPSDHTIGAFAIAGAIWLRSRAWGTAALVVAMVVAVGRVGLGVHYPLDVVAGAAIGMGAAAVLWLTPLHRVVESVSDRGTRWAEGIRAAS